MRKTLLAAAALAPLCLSAGPDRARAQTTVSASTNTPITTAKSGSVTINSGVTVQPTQPNTAAVTVNSNADVTNNGTIAYKDLNNVVGISLQGGNAGTVTNAGGISLTESYTTSDSNKDGVNEGPFASPTSTGRYGIQLVGSQPFVGSIFNQLTITVQGNNSYGISLEAPLQGALSQSGTISLTGDNGAALRETAGITGGVNITGAITTIGQNSNGVVLAGPVGGAVTVFSSISSTDYGLTTRPQGGTALQTIQNTPTEVNPNAGSAVVVSGSVGGGIFLGAPSPYANTSDATSVLDGSGVASSTEGTSSVVTYGQAPALVIGGAAPIAIGGFAASTPSSINNGFGVILEGTVAGRGVYDNVNSTGAQIGGLGGAVTVAGGVHVAVGATLDATSYGSATATALHIGAGANIPLLLNDGTISAAVTTPNSLSTTFPAFTGQAQGVVVDAGGTLSSFINTGSLTATLNGDQNDTLRAIALQDRGGGLSSVTNTGTISAAFTQDSTSATPAGSPVTLANGAVDASGRVALDLSANTTGVTLVQSQPSATVVTTDTSSGAPVVTVTSQAPGAGPYPITTTATTTTTVNGKVTTQVVQPISPSITGDIFLGNGPNAVSLLAGTVSGAISMGSGPTAQVTIDNGAIYAGALSYGGTSGPGLTLNVANGTFDNFSATSFKTQSLNVGSSGVIYFAIDPAKLLGGGTNAFYNVSGAANFASGSKLGLVFDSNLTAPATFTLVSASSLNVNGATTSNLIGPVPYMFNATLLANTATGQLQVQVSQKTPAQLGLNPSQAAALQPTYQALTQDTAVQSAFLSQYTRAGFLGVYNQILPDYAGGTFQAANAASLAIGRTTGEANEIENPTGSRGAWAEEIVVGVNQGQGRTDGFRGGGFGFVGGLETGGFGLGAFGVTTALVNTTIVDPHVPGDSQTAMTQLEVGGYWQGEFNGLVADARLAGGYLWFNGRRQFLQLNSNGEIALSRKVSDSWDGYSGSGRFGLAYRFGLGNRFLGGGWFVQPQVHADAFFLTQSAFSESQQQGGPALAMGFKQVDGHEASGTASVLIGRKLGQGLVFRPELEFGIRDVFSGTAGNLTAHYLSGGPNFTLTPADISGAAGVARFRLKASSEYYEVGFEAGTEILSSRYEEADGKVSIRVLF